MGRMTSHICWDYIVPNRWKNKKCSKPPTRYTNQQQKWVSNPSTLGISHTVSFPTGILRIPVPVGALETHELWNDYSSGVDIRKTDYLDWRSAIEKEKHHWPDLVHEISRRPLAWIPSYIFRIAMIWCSAWEFLALGSHHLGPHDSCINKLSWLWDTILLHWLWKMFEATNCWINLNNVFAATAIL